MGRNETMLQEAPFKKLIVNLCVPTVIIMVVMVIYNMADVFFIGQTGDPYMIAAVSLCGPLFSILSGLGTLFGSGGCTSLSLALGRKEQEKIRKITALCCYGALGIGLIFAMVVLVFLDPVCRLIGSDETTLAYTREYLRVIAAGAPVILFANVFTNLIRADGAAKESMAANLAGTITNIVLDPLMILVFQWGVTGAALATVLGNVASSGYLIWHVHKKCPGYSMKLEDVSIRKEILVPVVTLGLPMACSTILMSFSHMIANNMMMGYGSIAVAAQGVAGKVGMLISMTAMGICMGMQPAISYNYAAGNRKRLRMVVRDIGILAVAVGSTLSVLCFLFRDGILQAFIDNAQVLEIGGIMVTASSIVGPVYALYQLCTTYLQSTGKAGYATFTSLLDKCVVYLPVLFLMNTLFGMYGIIFTGAVTDTLSLVVAAVLCKVASGRDEKTFKVQDAQGVQ